MTDAILSAAHSAIACIAAGIVLVIGMTLTVMATVKAYEAVRFDNGRAPHLPHWH